MKSTALSNSGRQLNTALTMFLALVCWAMPMTEAWADDGPPATVLTLDEAIERALAANAELNAARAGLDVARARVLTARAYPNPELTVEGAPSIPDAEEYDYGLGLEQQVSIRGKVAKRVALANDELATESWSVEDRARRIVSAVRESYRRAQVIDRRVGLSRNLAVLNERLVRVARARFHRGEVSELDVHQFDVEFAQRSQEAERLVADRESAVIELSRLLNVSQFDGFALSPDIAGRQTAFPLVPLLEAARTRPDLNALRSEATAAGREEELRVAERWADPTIGIHYRRERTRFDDPVLIDDTSDFVGLQIKIPLPLLYRNEGDIAAALARKSTAEALRESALVNIDREVRDAHQRAGKQLQAIKGLERGIEAAKKGERLAEQAYKEGLIGAVQLIQAQQQRFSVENARLDALEAYYQALSDLEGAVNSPLEDVLAKATKVQP